MMKAVFLLAALAVIGIPQADDSPPINGKYWLHRHLIDKQELELIRAFQKRAETKYKITPAKKGVADDLLSIKTTKIETEHVLLESDVLTEAEMSWVARYAEALHFELADILGFDPKTLPLGRKHVVVFLSEGNYLNFAEKIFSDPREKEFFKSLVNFRFPLSKCKAACVLIDWKENRALQAAVPTLSFMTSFYTNKLASSVQLKSERLDVYTGCALIEYFGFLHDAYVVRFGETSEMERVRGGPFPDWVHAVYRHYFPVKAPRVTVVNPDGSTTVIEPKQPPPDEVHKLKYIIEGTLDGLDALASLKMWAFTDWLLLAQRDKLKIFYKTLREKATALGKELKTEQLSLEQTKRLIIESMESAFGKSMDEIEEMLKAYVQERYFPADQAEKYKRFQLYKTPEYKPE